MTLIPMNVLGRKEVKMRPTKWTETAIKQAFDTFIKEHDRLPTREEMYKKYVGMFPRPKSVKITMGVTIGEYLELHYNKYLHRCQSRIYCKRTKEYWVENFKKQYTQFNKPQKDEYDKLRSSGTPNSKTLTRIVGVSTWSEFLEYCGFQKDDKVEIKGGIVFEPTLENLQKLSKKLQEILESF